MDRARAPDVAALARLSADKICGCLESASTADSLSEFSPLCSALVSASTTSPPSAARIASGIMQFLGSPGRSDAIAASACHVVGSALMVHHAAVSTAVLGQYAGVVELLRRHARDATVVHLVLTITGALTAAGTSCQTFAQGVVASSGILALFSEVVERHLACSDPDVACAAFLAAMNLSFRQREVKEQLVGLHFPELAARALVLRGRGNWKLFGEASGIIVNLLAVAGTQAAVLECGLIPALFGGLSYTLRSQDPALTPAYWCQFASSSAMLYALLLRGGGVAGNPPVCLTDSQVDAAAATVVDCLRTCLLKPYSASVIEPLLDCVDLLCDRGGAAAEALKNHAAVDVLKEVAVRFPYLRDAADHARNSLICKHSSKY